MREYCNGLRWPTPHFRRCVTAQKNRISKVQQLNTIFISEQRLFSCPRQSCCVRAQGREMFLQSVGQLEYQWGCLELSYQPSRASRGPDPGEGTEQGCPWLP